MNNNQIPNGGFRRGEEPLVVKSGHTDISKSKFSEQFKQPASK